MVEGDFSSLMAPVREPPRHPLAHGAARRARRLDHRRDLARRVLARAVGDRRRCRRRRDHRGGSTPRCPDLLRHDPGRRRSAGRRLALRLHGLPHLQVAVLAARRRLPHDERARRVPAHARAGGLVRRRRLRGRTATARRSTWRPTLASSMSRPRGRPGSARSSRSVCSPTSTSTRCGSARLAWATPSATPSASRSCTSRSSPGPTPRASDLRTLIDAGIRVSGRAGRVRASFHLWNTLDDVEAVLRALKR